jgi:nitrogen regulatory protein PII
MKPVLRVEIVIESAFTPRVLEALSAVGLSDHTLIREVQGRGDRGERRGEELTDRDRNCLILVACEPDREAALTGALRPLLARYGGMCLVSEARWLRH